MAIKSNYPNEPNLGHVMLDLETMGKRAGCAIVSIGAVEFDINTGEIVRTFYKVVNLQSCLNVGLFIDASTLYWWLQQSDAARQAICKPADSIQSVLEELRSFFACLGDFQIWGDGARFDIGILEAAYFAIGRGETLPWYFRNERDVRTLVSFEPEIIKNLPFTGTMHNPIDDCIHQINYCSRIWKNKNLSNKV
jgi:hypothetical protein